MNLKSRVVYLVTLVQFVHIVDFMMVAPLGPDLAFALDFDAGLVGWVTGSYAITAAFSSILAALFIDRIERRLALFFTIGCMSAITILSALSQSVEQLIAARMLAGFFGGPASAVAISMVIDVIPEKERGRAMGMVMGAFSLAAILGVPLGLYLAQWGGWWLPFVMVGAAGLLVMLLLQLSLPPMRSHIQVSAEPVVTVFADLLRQPALWWVFVSTGLSMLAAFSIIPNISAFIQFNMGFPRQDIGELYFWGGLISLIAMRVAGMTIDRIKEVPVATVATLLLIIVLYASYYVQPSLMTVPVMFVLFMLAMSIRNVSTQTLVSRMPQSHQRAAFMSLSGSFQHISAGLASALGAMILVQEESGALQNMPQLALISMAAAACLPFMLAWLQRYRIV